MTDCTKGEWKVSIGGNELGGWHQWDGQAKQHGWELKMKVKKGVVSGSCANDSGVKTKKKFSGTFDGTNLDVTATFTDGSQTNTYKGTVSGDMFSGRVAIIKGNNLKGNIGGKVKIKKK